MSFQSFSFLAFLAGTVLVCLALARRSRPAAVAALELACVVFYVAGDGWRSLAVLAAGALVTRAALVRLADAAAPHRRRTLVLACIWHIGVLAVFKYTAFFTGGAVSVGWAPLGLSFFTFQQLWLLKEVYDGSFRLPAQDGLVLYALFFPTVTSGPILRPEAFFPQLEGPRFLHPDWEDAAAGLDGIVRGMAKKVLLADALGVLVDNGWAGVEALTAPAAWLVILAYTFQLYLDFSGYCDIAAGAARLLGVRLPMNFDMPYRSLSVGEFWKRWHMTLTTFLRECVYFPLGGSRQGTIRAFGNILIVYLISGLWHGAGWTFVIWGALHGAAQIVERIWSGRQRLPSWLRWCGTFLFVNLAWVFFRAPDLAAAGTLLRAAVLGSAAAPQDWLLEGFLSTEREALALLAPALAEPIAWAAMAAVLVIAAAVSLLPRGGERPLRPSAVRCAAEAAVLAWCVLSFTGITSFIYSNF